MVHQAVAGAVGNLPLTVSSHAEETWKSVTGPVDSSHTAVTRDTCLISTTNTAPASARYEQMVTLPAGRHALIADECLQADERTRIRIALQTDEVTQQIPIFYPHLERGQTEAHPLIARYSVNMLAGHYAGRTARAVQG